jgi:hypothetical protein
MKVKKIHILIIILFKILVSYPYTHTALVKVLKATSLRSNFTGKLVSFLNTWLVVENPVENRVVLAATPLMNVLRVDFAAIIGKNICE